MFIVYHVTWKLLEKLTLARATYTHVWARNAEGVRRGQDRTKKTYTWKRRNSFKGSTVHVFFILGVFPQFYL